MYLPHNQNHSYSIVRSRLLK